MLINTYDKDNSGEINFDGFLVWYWYCNMVLQYGIAIWFGSVCYSTLMSEVRNCSSPLLTHTLLPNRDRK